MSNCLSCAQWALKDSKNMAKAGFAYCRFDITKSKFYGPTQTCNRHRPLAEIQVQARQAYIDKIGVK